MTIPNLEIFALCSRLIPLGLVLALSACQTGSPDSSSVDSGGKLAEPVYLTGTGASFPVFLYQRWIQTYTKDKPNLIINYQPNGSAAGVRQFMGGTVDFAGSDVAITDEEMAQVEAGVILIPATAGSVAIAYNLPDVPSGLKLSREVYPAIFLGQIQRWNDPQIAALNPDVVLPDLPILSIHRSDGSGTTAAFTRHLSAISEDWRDRVGSGVNVSWPVGTGVKSNSGVSAQIQQGVGTIGYLEVSYATQLGLSVAALENQAGQFQTPTLAASEAGVADIDLPDNLRGFNPDPASPEAYPIVTYSWLLVYENYGDDTAKAQELEAFLDWSLTNGQALSAELDYIPLPEAAVEKARTIIADIAD
ncbi:MAG: phosphate ABC transporter substrate-binding protein PstS [Cyanobacteria bacterium P01_H01_bin.15]